MHEKINNIWKSISGNKLATVEDHLALCIAKATLAKSNNDKKEILFNQIKKTFTPTTNVAKLENGWHEWKALSLAANTLAFQGLRKNPLFINFNEMEFEIAVYLLSDLRNLFSVLGGYDPEDKDSPLYDPTQVFLIVRKNMPPIHQLIQTAHVASVVGATGAIPDPMTQHFIVYGAENGDQLMDVSYWLNSVNVEVNHFYDNVENTGFSVTAIATGPIRKSYAERKQLFTGLDLLVL